MSDLIDKIQKIHTRRDLASFIADLAEDLRRNPDEWENVTLESFLQALAGWTKDMDGYYRNRNEDVPLTPQWRTFADMLAAAGKYE